MNINIQDRYVFLVEIVPGLIFLLLAILNVISYDLVIAVMLASFSPALFPTILDNFRYKRGMNVHTTLPTTWGQVIIGVSLYMLGLVVSATISFVLAVVWGILLLQAFAYRGRGDGS